VSQFIKSQTSSEGALPPPLAEDAFAWYLLGGARLRESQEGDKQQAPRAAERDFRKSVELDPQFARAHRSLALSLMLQVPPSDVQSPQAQEAQRELDRARELDPGIKLKSTLAFAAVWHKDFPRAQQRYAEAVAEDPDDLASALGLGAAVLQNANHAGPRAPVIRPLVERHGDDGTLRCIYGLTLAHDDDAKAAVEQFRRARELGVDPSEVFGKQLVDSVEQAARPGPIEILKTTAVWFLSIYAGVIAVMALAGVVLGSFTRGTNIMRLLANEPMEVVSGGQVVRSPSEPWLARLYAVSLVLGLILFYVALPFIAAGLLAGTLGVLWLIFQAKRIPIKLVVIVVVVGLGMVWAVLKSMFARMGSGSFGIVKTDSECPKLFEALREVARRVDTSPVDEVYIAPGTEIGVHQEGRGPWGMFGTKRRVLTLGLATLRTLTVTELKSILAHEYAHFSHQDTHYSRFIHRVDLSIHTALSGMGAAGGKLNYINPFFWFLVLYYRAYSLLSAGFSRSREYLADRMACSLYGSKVFTSALTKVCTDGPLFDATMYNSIAGMLSEGRAFKNLYEAFAEFRQVDSSSEDRAKISKSLEEERPSFFASHPTYQERIAAARAFPPGRDNDANPAIQLFDDPAALEEQLTEYVTGAIHLAQQQAQAAAAAE
ncbi:MAG: M48 family metalloprotease, partial [Planctomycetia bacterium]|nr:M48 family metalloprotease [Planctomycetia bacterium]